MELAHVTSQFEFQQLQLHSRVQPGPKRVCDPDVALAVDRHSLAAVSAGRKHIDLTRITRRKARHRVTDRICNPNAVLLVDRQVEGSAQFARTIFVWFAVGGLAEEFRFARVTLRQIDHPILFKVESPDVTFRGNDNALHDAELPTEVIALVW